MLQESDTSGSTALVVVFDGRSRSILVANVGDSRCVASCGGGVAARLSSDHRLSRPDERARVVVSGGEPTQREAETSPNGNPFTLLAKKKRTLFWVVSLHEMRTIHAQGIQPPQRRFTNYSVVSTRGAHKRWTCTQTAPSPGKLAKAVAVELLQ